MISKETIEKALEFRDQRDWKQFHNPKDLAISLCLEASELLEIYQWSAEDLYCKEKIAKVAEELADVLMYSIDIADAYGLDMDEIILAKLKRNAEKYPVSKSYGSKAKYSELKMQAKEKEGRG
jgi:NTP pyrophosphatase (non-canonical NTP hydrolase)